MHRTYLLDERCTKDILVTWSNLIFGDGKLHVINREPLNIHPTEPGRRTLDALTYEGGFSSQEDIAMVVEAADRST